MIKSWDIARSFLGRWVELAELGHPSHPENPQEHDDVVSIDGHDAAFDFWTRDGQTYRITVKRIAE